MLIQEKIGSISKRIWDDIYHADLYNTIYGEETITDSILLEIARLNNYNLRIIQTPKNIESQQGTDWEWYIGSQEYGWTRFAIQAKKNNLSTFRYDSLDHTVGENPNQRKQIEILKLYSETNKAIPLYSFYNYKQTAKEGDHWHCGKPYVKELLGWTFTTLKNVEEAILKRGGRTFDKLHSLKDTLAMKCLFDCPIFLKQYQDKKMIDKETIIFNTTYKKIESLPSSLIRGKDIISIDDFPEELYNREIKIYPKRIVIFDIKNKN